MSAMIDPTLLPALNAIERALERRPVRHYTPDPAVDQPRVEPELEEDAEQFFLDQQCPSDSTFR